VDGRPITNKECFYLMMLISFSPFLARIDLYYDLPDLPDEQCGGRDMVWGGVEY
jgi:hypothetical protein